MEPLERVSGKWSEQPRQYSWAGKGGLGLTLRALGQQERDSTQQCLGPRPV